MAKATKTLLLIITLTYVLFSCRSKENSSNKNWTKADGYVPDSITAVKVAEVIISRVYGLQSLNKKPFLVEQTDTTWIIDGSLQEGEDGGVPHIEIRKSDCKIVNVSHSK